MNKKHNGFSLLELIVVLGVTLIISFTTITAGKQASKNAIKSQLSSEAMMLRKTIGNLYINGDYTGISSTVLINSRTLPRSMNLNGTLVHANNGTIDIRPAAPYGQANKGYMIIFNNLENYACNYLVNNMADMFLSVAINGTFVKVIGGTLATPSVITTNCTASLGNAVAFVGL